MRNARLGFLLFLTASATVLACGAGADDESGDQDQAVVGGSEHVESSVVYLFETKDAKVPRCAGALLSETIAVTARPCAKVGMMLGRAMEGDGKKTQALAKAIHVPEGADPDIAVIELDRPLKGSYALVTHAPLQKGYKVNGVATLDLRWWQPGPDQGEVASVDGELVSETEMHGALIPAKGTQLCLEDIGAPVCSSTAYHAGSFEIRGTCGLAGIVVAAPELPAQTPGVAAPSALNKEGCSPGAWKMAQLGRHAEFLKRFAPKAFQPLTFEGNLLLENFPYVPDGLWGYKSSGEVASCKIETPKLEEAVVNTDVKVAARASFKNMAEKAVAYGRFGIAPRSAPNNVRWMPAKATIDKAKGNSKAFDASFEGVVRADRDGDYVVLFRATANGGETWTPCDGDPAEPKFEPEKAPPLKVGVIPGSEPTPPATADGGAPVPANGAAPTSPTASSDYSDEDPAADSPADPPSGSGPGSTPDAVASKKKKKAAASGCSASPSGGSPSGPLLPALGVLLGLSALRRRRR
jgi:MYXO-CTERM domain-containing protein